MSAAILFAAPSRSSFLNPIRDLAVTIVTTPQPASVSDTVPVPRGLGFGTAPVFLASISTILGAVMFLRFGYAVGHQGLLGSLLIILIGHAVTIPTALAIAEIATNRRVEGGGEYFIISRSFGITIGGAIGVSLYLSQAVSVAFYMIAFAEAFRPLTPWFEQMGIAFDPRYFSVPGTLALVTLVLTRGANLGVKALWVVVSLLVVSLVLFFAGSAVADVEREGLPLLERAVPNDPFILVFAICFPAFTGMTAGVGLSGDLRNPSKSIPRGILSATLIGMLVYVALVVKLALSATPAQLAEDQLIMARIAVWGPAIYIGLAAATMSSAIGSILVAPRTLQALAADRFTPFRRANYVLSRGVGSAREPRNATILTAILALVTVALGNVDFVARIISMFFMVTYGALCAISFLEHLAARPAYRPSFRSKWYLSLLGAVMCFLLAFQMDPLYAIIATIVMIGIYQAIRRGRRTRGDDLSAIFRGVMTQVTRTFQVRLQHAQQPDGASVDWRPSIIMVDSRTFERAAPLRFLTWLCHRYGFGTYIHFIRGHLTPDTFAESREALQRMIRGVNGERSSIYLDTMISPSMTSALAQSLQLPGVSGMENNTALFECELEDGDDILAEVHGGSRLAGITRMNTLVLRHGALHFGRRAAIHIWLKGEDYNNASLMILLAYILMGHPDWESAEILIFAAVPRAELSGHSSKLMGMLETGRIPISEKNVTIIPVDSPEEIDRLVQERSENADLVMVGLSELRFEEGPAAFRRFPALRDVLFVTAREQVMIE